jgi:hypothetical protein
MEAIKIKDNIQKLTSEQIAELQVEQNRTILTIQGGEI